jgi:iron complex outermembrane receptor protein
VEYTPQPDLLFYGRISTGFRAGGFNQISGSLASLEQKIPPSFDGEELLNYEVGIKGLFLDNRLMLTAGAYFQDFSKYHLNATQFIEAEKRATYEDPFSEFTDSLGDTEIWGFEVEATLHLSDQWRLSGFYNFLDSSVGPHMAFFDDDRDVPREQFFHTWVDRDCRIDGGSVEECTEISEEPSDLPRAVGGNVLPQQPKHKGALTLTYTQPLGQMGTITALTTWSYTGTRWSDIGNVPYAQLDAYDRLDLRATWDSPGGDWSVTGFVQNVMDNITIQEYAYGNAWLTEPRQMGVQIRWRPNRQ